MFCSACGEQIQPHFSIAPIASARFRCHNAITAGCFGTEIFRTIPEQRLARIRLWAARERGDPRLGPCATKPPSP